MNIYIFHKKFLNTFKLPTIVEGNYLLYDFVDNQKRNLINIEAKDGKWVAKSNTDVNISLLNANSKLNDVVIEANTFYLLTINGIETVMIYASDYYENNFLLKTFKSDGVYNFGSESKNDVILLSQFIAKSQFSLSLENDKYYLKILDQNGFVYVNGIVATNSYLSTFDTIFIMGIKIVIVGKNLLISCPKKIGLIQSTTFVDPTLKLTCSDYNTDNKVYKNYYDEKSFFSRSPIFQEAEKKLQISFSDPPEISDKGSEKQSIIVDVVPSILMSLSSLLSTYYSIQNYNNGKTDKEGLYTNLLMCVIMMVTGIVWPFINSVIQTIRHKLHFKRVKWVYTRYLKKKEKEINDLAIKQKMIFSTNYLSSLQCVDILEHRTSYLYCKHSSSPDFLTIRLGIGERPFECDFSYSKPDFSMEDLSLYKKVENIIGKYKYLNDSPITFSLRDNNSISFINKGNLKYDYMFSILFQLLVLHGYDELKLVVLTDEIGSSKFSILKNINHIWNAEHDLRFFVDNINESQEVFDYLDSKFVSNKDAKSKIDVHYLIVTDCINLYKNQSLINDILSSDKNFGFSIMIFDDDINNAPSECNYFVDYTFGEATLFRKDMNESYTMKFKPELVYDKNIGIDVPKLLEKLSDIPLKMNTSKASNLVSHLGFLEMLGVGNVEQLNSAIKWKDDSIINSLATPVGVDSFNNLVNLDLHEKRHGPHGLIAGMTGSGKSEFIITYILSLAVNYSPEEVQFVLIDYKGGGLAGAFENRKTNVKLPHLAGTITNLDKSEMNRTLVSIQSELQKRQRKFNEAKEKLNTGTIDIYKYQKLHREGKLNDTISHLFIICDEFAELKSQQPDFMDQLISTARIGRSLGVHLILATQKPSGVVDDQIWSNSKFKVCCKVQTTEDSNEMIRRPDAAYLTDAGRFYLQVGYDQYFILGQSAYTGTKYIPSNKVGTTLDTSIEVIDNLGKVIKNIEDNDNKISAIVDHGEELTNILTYLIKVAQENNVCAEKLWLDNIPNNIYLSDIQKKYNYKLEKNVINPIIGEYDDPEHQQQGLVTLPITFGGNCYICGDTGAGKTTLLSSIIYSTIIAHSSNEVNIYIIDYGAETLKNFIKAPQVGEVITSENSKKVNTLFNRIKMQIKERKEILSEKNIDYFSYIKHPEYKPLPQLLIFINGIDAFVESFEDLVLYEFPSILRESNKYGITLIITGTVPNAIGYTILNQIPQKIALKLTNSEYYSSLLDTRLVPSQNPGRGLIRINESVYQFQCVQIFNEEQLNDNLNYVFKTLQSTLVLKAPDIPFMPDFINSDLLIDYVSNIKNVPIGYNISTVLPLFYNFDNYINFILASSLSNLSKFVNSLLKLLIMSGNIRAIILDGNHEMKIKTKEKNIKYYDSDFIKLLPFLKENNDKNKDNSNFVMPIFVIGYQDIESALLAEKSNNPDIMTLSDLITECKDSKIFRFIFLSSECYSTNWEDFDWFTLFNSKNGIYIGNDDSSQDIIIGKKRDDEYKLELDNSNAYVFIDGNKEIIKYIMD